MPNSENRTSAKTGPLREQDLCENRTSIIATKNEKKKIAVAARYTARQKKRFAGDCRTPTTVGYAPTASDCLGGAVYIRKRRWLSLRNVLSEKTAHNKCACEYSNNRTAS